MIHRSLSDLTDDSFVIDYSVISSPPALHRALRASKQVEHLRIALGRGELTEKSLRDSVATLLRDLEYGKKFPHDLALATIAVALETRPTAFAEEYVLDLARLDLAEFPMAIRVARLASLERAKLTANKTKSFLWTIGEISFIEWQRAPEPHPISVSQVRESFELETV
jgi:hypothetical protein